MLTMRILFAIAACSLTILISASNSYPQPQPKTENKPTTQDKRGTQESPLIIQGDITTKAAEKPESDRKQEEEKIEIERSIAKYTGIAAAITGVLVLVTGVLACFTYKLWKSTNDLAIDARKTAGQQAKDTRASLDIAEASVWAARAGVDLAREEFIATYCPRLIIRRLNIWQDSGNNAQLVVNYEIANIGGTRAKIIEISARLWLPETWNQFPPVPPYAPGDKSSEKIVESGCPYRGQHYTCLTEEIEAYNLRLSYAEGRPRDQFAPTDVYFFGYIVYLDQLGRRFETAFLREYNFRTKRFSPVDDPDYEYLA